MAVRLVAEPFRVRAGDRSVRDDRVAGHLPERVFAVDVAYRSRPGPHDERMGGRTAGPVPHSLEQIAVGDSGRREEGVIRRYEVIGREDPVKIVPSGDGPVTFLLVSGR